jgi:hypothetical protein
MRHSLRSFLLALSYSHPAAVAVAFRRGPRATKQYLPEMYRCSKTDAGSYLPVVTLEDIAEVQTEFKVLRPADWGGSISRKSARCVIWLQHGAHAGCSR